jgi:TolB-like protein/class 3 adenylate cyclase/cytochrome c-type biogenesis protein CcmH/NrfG
MPDEEKTKLRLEIAHVLFIDIVGYSKLRISQQSELLRELNEIVSGTQEFRTADNEGKLIRLPTGDGMALVFRTSPEAPAQCALEISQALKEHHPDIHLRMGIHSGPVNEVVDVNQRANIAGAGINLAQRVMDCGDAGHILVSKHVAEDLEQYDHWQPCLHDLGECEVKHGVRVHLFNLYTDEVGNSEIPEKFKSAAVVARTPKRGVNRKVLLLSGTAAVLLVGLVGFWLFKRSSAARVAAVVEKSVAVLPFENLSEDKANAYFADGIQDEILTKLASIADLKVISRTSTAKYKSKPEDLKTVSQQLGVANVVEGTVQRAADKVRVNVQLIDARADAHLWAKSYDRDVKDVFAVESEVSQEIAEALRAKLSPNETSTLAAAPTKDPEAYDFFLKGEYEERQAEGSHKLETYDQAASWYRQAISRDPHFALAIARLAENEVWRHYYFQPLNDADLQKVKSTAEQALALAPDLAQGHIALGLYYYLGRRQFDQALGEFQRAQELQPNNVQALNIAAHVHRRQGQWRQHLSELARCEQLDPRDAQIPAQIGASFCRLRMWEEANRAGLRSLALDPHSLPGMIDVLLSCINGTGHIEKARQTLATFPADSLIAVSYKYGGEVSNISGQASYVYVVMRDYAAALKAWDKNRGDPIAERDALSARAAIHVIAGDAAAAHDEIERAHSLVETRLREQPDDRQALVQLSWIDVALQRNSEALTVARQAAEAMSPEKDAVEGPEFLAGLAEIEARTGDASAAVKTLRQVLLLPAGMVASIERLKIDPVWDPIRNDPGFQQLLAGKEQIGPNN